MVAVSFFVHKSVIDCHLVGKVFEMLRVLCEVFDIAENKLGFPLIRMPQDITAVDLLGSAYLLQIQ